MAVADRFKTLLARIEPSATTTQLYESHRSGVTARLKTVFAANKVVLIGSNARDTAIGRHSDVDLLLVLSRSEVTRGGSLISSETVLKNVRVQLEDRYTATKIGKDGQAIVVDFRDGDHPVDVVPAFYEGPAASLNNYPVFRIPDGEGGWMQTSPDAHNRYIIEADQRSRGKLKGVVRLIKFWRTTRNVPLNSFHVELLLAENSVCDGVKSYAECVADAMALLAERGCRGLQDPLGISGIVKAANTEAKRQQAVASLRQCAEHAKQAVGSDCYGYYTTAYQQWDFVFNGQFPKQ